MSVDQSLAHQLAEFGISLPQLQGLFVGSDGFFGLLYSHQRFSEQDEVLCILFSVHNILIALREEPAVLQVFYVD